MAVCPAPSHFYAGDNLILLFLLLLLILFLLDKPPKAEILLHEAVLAIVIESPTGNLEAQ